MKAKSEAVELAELQGVSHENEALYRLVSEIIKNPIVELLTLIAALERMQDAQLVSPILKDAALATAGTAIVAQQIAPLAPYIADVVKPLLSAGGAAASLALLPK